jgi:hypothetical protein
MGYGYIFGTARSSDTKPTITDDRDGGMNIYLYRHGMHYNKASYLLEPLQCTA